jgi:hypothetical protein
MDYSWTDDWKGKLKEKAKERCGGIRSVGLPLLLLLHYYYYISIVYYIIDSLYSLVVRIPGYRSRRPGSIPGATRFSEKY